MSLTITVLKPSTPTLWLDTSIIIKLTKLASGELSSAKEPRLAELRDVILGLVEAGKLDVPVAEQEDEYAFRRMDFDIAVEHRRYSRGAELRPRFEISRSLALRGMGAFIRRESELILGSGCFFSRHPAGVSLDGGTAIAVAEPGTPVTAAQRQLWQGKVEHCEGIRSRNETASVPYERQLELELSGDMNGWRQEIRQLLETTLRGAASDPLTLFGFRDLVEYRDEWAILGGEPAGFDGVFTYLGSDVYKGLPHVRVAAQLWADILTGTETVKGGDPGDVDMLSVAIPACSLLLVDNRQRLRIEKRRIAEPWGARVFSMKTSDELLAHLRSL